MTESSRAGYRYPNVMHLQPAQPSRSASSLFGLLALALLSACGGGSPGTVTVGAYNIWMIPTAPEQGERAAQIPAAMPQVDAVVLSEAFDPEHAATLTSRAAALGYSSTAVLANQSPGRCAVRLGPIRLQAPIPALNGGVLILSRHPIRRTAERLFGQSMCSGEDCCAAKGVLYAEIELPSGHPLHLFGTHLQNPSPMVGGDASTKRTEQLRAIRSFMDEVLAGAEPGPVIVAGDLNVPESALAEAKSILRVSTPLQMTGGPSWGRDNSHTDDEPDAGRLDYVLPTNDYEAPSSASNTTVRARATVQVSTGFLGLGGDEAQEIDLSDHHPVVGQFEW